MFKRVAEYCAECGIKMAKEPSFPSIMVRDENITILKMEIDEFSDAYKKNNIYDMSLTLTNICYIIARTCLCCGIAPEGKHESPFVGKFDLFVHTHPDTILYGVFGQYKAADADDDLDRMKTELMHLMMFVFGIALHFGIPINSLFEEQHRQNMSRLGK